MFVKYILEFIEIHLEFFFLEKDNSSSFWDLDVLSFKTFSFTNKLKNSNIEINIKWSSIRFSYNKCSLKTSFCSFNFFAPSSKEPLFINLKFKSNSVITSKLSLKFILSDSSLWELMDRSSNFLKQMSSPNNFTSLRRHISYCWRILFSMFVEFLLDWFKVSSINM